jgi:hypothetical protein
MHRHEMQQLNIYLGIYIIEYYFFWKNQGVTFKHLIHPINVLHVIIIFIFCYDSSTAMTLVPNSP